MSAKLLALKLFLKELVIQPFDDDHVIQKSVYLGQVAGADLGYRFGWFTRGPLSLPLATDLNYVRFAENADKRKLIKPFREALKRVISLLEPPNGVDESVWLETVASIHFLRFVSRYSEERVREYFERERQHLMWLYAVALNELAWHFDMSDDESVVVAGK